jgi:hypothetical protein
MRESHSALAQSKANFEYVFNLRVSRTVLKNNFLYSGFDDVKIKNKSREEQSHASLFSSQKCLTAVRRNFNYFHFLRLCLSVE